MKNKKHILRYLAAGVLLISCFNLSAQRYRHERWEKNSYSCRHYPSVRTYVGIRNFGYRPYYRDNYYYHPFRRPSIGVVISVLPFGYRTIYPGPDPYYYYSGVYYRPYTNHRYEVVNPPEGAMVPELPTGAKAEIINGQKFYEYEGTYYKENITVKGEILYEVVGKNAVLNTDDAPNTTQTPQQSPVVSESSESIGMQTERLPDNCKTVVINQLKFYQSPSGFYYQEIIKDNKVSYQVVGKATDSK